MLPNFGSGGVREMLSKHQEERLKIMKIELGVYGDSWTKREYPEKRIYYGGGPPHRFWLHVDSEAVWHLTHFIKVWYFLISMEEKVKRGRL